MRVQLARSGLLDRAGVISAYLAIGDEIDPLAVLDPSQGSLCLPVMIAKGQPLQFRRWSPGAPLVARMWGIREPDAAAETVTPDTLLVPLLAFDRTGTRLGYGGGFFDRTLAALRASGPVTAIGLAFDAQQVDSVPQADYDEPLDYVVTPTRLMASAR